MSKRKKPRQQKGASTRPRKSKKSVALLLIVFISLLCVGTIAAPWKGSSGVQKLRAFLASPPPPVPPPSSPSKEYVYAGGKLIATEEPAIMLLAPTSLSALTVSNEVAPRVSITWHSVSGAAHYEVEKTSDVNVPYSSVSSNVSGTTFNDTNVNAVTAYLYRVRAVDSQGNPSPYSNLDLATAITFTDDSLISQSTNVKAAHITELRQAVDAIRTMANRPPTNWGGSITQFSTTIQAAHIQDLRTNLNDALSALNFAQCSYTDNSIPALQDSFFKKEHIEQLRQCVR